MSLALAPFVPPSAPSAGADGGPPPARTAFLNIGPGGFNEANTSPQGDKAIKLSGSAAALIKTGDYAGAVDFSKSGGVFLSRPIYSETGFSALFKIHLGARTGGTDGWSFVVAKDANSVGGAGDTISYKSDNSAENCDLYGWVDYDPGSNGMRFFLGEAPQKPGAPTSTISLLTAGSQYYIGFTSAGNGSSQQTYLEQFYVFNGYAPDVSFKTEDGKGVGVYIPGQSAVIEDCTPPSPPVITQSARGMTNTLTAFTLGGSEDANGVKKYQYKIGNETVWRDYAAAGNFVFDGSLVKTAALTAAGGSVTVYARALDNGGNISDETSATLRYNIAPGPTLVSPADK
jgi:hypothetical protein